MKKKVRLTESNIRRIVKESVRRVIREMSESSKTGVLDDNDWEILICGDLNDEETLYRVIDKCKANGITLEDIISDYHCDKLCTERGCDESDIRYELSEYFL